jgi:hypothetical protein
MKGRRPGLQRMEAWARPTVVLVVPRVTSKGLSSILLKGTRLAPTR